MCTRARSSSVTAAPREPAVPAAVIVAVPAAAVKPAVPAAVIVAVPAAAVKSAAVEPGCLHHCRRGGIRCRLNRTGIGRGNRCEGDSYTAAPDANTGAIYFILICMVALLQAYPLLPLQNCAPCKACRDC